MASELTTALRWKNRDHLYAIKRRAFNGKQRSARPIRLARKLNIGPPQWTLGSFSHPLTGTTTCMTTPQSANENNASKLATAGLPRRDFLALAGAAAAAT